MTKTKRRKSKVKEEEEADEVLLFLRIAFLPVANVCMYSVSQGSGHGSQKEEKKPLEARGALVCLYILKKNNRSYIFCQLFVRYRYVFFSLSKCFDANGVPKLNI